MKNPKLKLRPNNANKKTYIVGSHITQFGELWSVSFYDLIQESLTKAIQDAKIKPSEIEAVFVGNMAAQQFEGQAHINAVVSSYLPHHPPTWRVEAACASGGMAAVSAELALLSGKYQTVLVLGVEKMTDVSTEQTTSILAGAAHLELEPASTFPSLYALCAADHMSKHGTTLDDLAFVSIKNHKNAMSNPKAQFHKQITHQDVQHSPVVSSPLRVLDCSPITDGAAAVVLSTKPTKKTQKATEILGWGVGQDTLALSLRNNIDGFVSTKKAADDAFASSGLSREEIEVVEVHDCFTIAEIMAVEDLGFCKKGDGSQFLRAHENTVNQSGGLKACGHPVGATGVKQLAWMHQHLQSPQNQHKIGLTHNVGGVGATAVVHILQSSNTLSTPSKDLKKEKRKV